jgi:hypothetical protein
MPLATLLNSDDPIFDFEHMMQHRRYFSVMGEHATNLNRGSLNQFSTIPYGALDPSWSTDQPAWMWNKFHQQAHNDFNTDLPSNYNDGFTTAIITPVPPPTPPNPPYTQGTAMDGGTFGIPQAQILIEGNGGSQENRSWWTFVNHQQHFIANDAILPLPTTSSTTAGTPPGQITASNPWWWAARAPVNYPFW